MDALSLSCEVNIVQAKNLEFIKSQGDLFVRFYLSAGNDQKVQLNTREIPANSGYLWNESFKLECLGSEDSINDLKQQTVVFELRWRSTTPVLGKLGGSRLLGRAEVPWKTVLESPEMEIRKWVVMVSKKSSAPEGFKAPSVQVVMRVGVPTTAVGVEKKKNIGGRKRREHECSCCRESGCKSCEDYEVFALVAALEAFFFFLKSSFRSILKPLCSFFGLVLFPHEFNYVLVIVIV